MAERVRKTEVSGGGVLLEKETYSAPLDDTPKIQCAVCWRTEQKHRLAVVALKDDPIRFVAINADLEQPFMGLCRRHAEKTQKKLKKRMRRMQRFATNLYAPQEKPDGRTGL